MLVNGKTLKLRFLGTARAVCSFLHRGILKFAMVVNGNKTRLDSLPLFTAHERGNLPKLAPLTELVNDNMFKFRCLVIAFCRKEKQE